MHDNNTALNPLPGVDFEELSCEIFCILYYRTYFMQEIAVVFAVGVAGAGSSHKGPQHRWLKLDYLNIPAKARPSVNCRILW